MDERIEQFNASLNGNNRARYGQNSGGANDLRDILMDGDNLGLSRDL